MSCLVPTEASGGDDTHVQDMCVVNLERLRRQISGDMV